jgi:hypothetical protein
MKCFGIAVLATTLLLPAIAQAELSDQDRATLNTMCLTKQRGAPQNAHLSEAALVFYCDCVSRTLAGMTSPAELRSPNEAVLAERAHVVGGMCIYHYYNQFLNKQGAEDKAAMPRRRRDHLRRPDRQAGHAADPVPETPAPPQ